MLWLVREQKPDIDVVYFENMPHPTKHQFARKTAASLGLKLTVPQAIYRDVIGGEKIEIVELYQIAPRRMIYSPIFAHPLYKADNQAVCALDRLNDPICNNSNSCFDAVFLGHKNTDTDSLGDPIPLQNDFYEAEDGFRYLYPLKDWADEDIWKATELLSIPQNWRRYQRDDLSANNDYYPLCTKCLGSDCEVICPQTNLPLPGMRSILKLDERREAWRKTFVNIEQGL